MRQYVVPDAVHGPIRLSADERELLAEPAFRRLGRIHQLALLHLLYPRAGYSRLEHSLGVMELATRIYDTMTEPANLSDEIRAALPTVNHRDQRRYWRRVVRAAALSHDLGHLPFSHAAERTLLPPPWNHERLSHAVIMDDAVGSGLEAMGLRRIDVAKAAVGPAEMPQIAFSAWERILSDIIVSSDFGADRLDYLQRDPRRTGVSCQRFDCRRLIASLRILPGRNSEPRLGLLQPGRSEAAALQRARHYMFSAVYNQPAARANNVLLAEFLQARLLGGMHPINVAAHLQASDEQVEAAMFDAARDPRAMGHEPARRLARAYSRKHFALREISCVS